MTVQAVIAIVLNECQKNTKNPQLFVNANPQRKQKQIKGKNKFYVFGDNVY
jgi:hypothetical protein